ncbi:sigma-54-dependent Fis family transcriptional regulator [Amycolatopsis sp. NPDC051903]|uniref:sigma-54-dependent Fis family transcriptional regulator n=1 Tax=Amycolatopsis sp. NPDC051903 TaxID=3363936 RepID=UPI0037A70E6C
MSGGVLPLAQLPDHDAKLRPQIADSWRRSQLFGVAPDLDPGVVSLADVDAGSRLMVAAGPVLDRLTQQLEGTRFCVLLADRDCRLVFRWFGHRPLQLELENIGVLLGSHFAEGRVGTNALGTPYESRQAVVIHGAEHYAHALKRFSCYGHPIHHPLTGRLEGVLDITGMSDDENPLFGPLVSRAVADIRDAIVEGARAPERQLFLAFQHATQRRSAPVAVLGGDVVFATETCIEQLRPGDPALLRTLLPDVPPRGVLTTRLAVADGVDVAVTAERVDGAPGGAVFQVCRTAGRCLVPRAETRRTGRARLITGEPGTGRSTLASGAGDVEVLGAATALRLEPREWAARFTDLTARAGTTVVVDDVHLLPDAFLVPVAAALDHGCPAKLVLTACPAGELPAAAAAVVARCDEAQALAPLRDRPDELPALLSAMIRADRPEWRPRFTGGALAALRAHLWPGNLHELRSVARHVTALPCTGVVDVAQLPKQYRSTVKTRRLGGREAAERNAIVTALRSNAGNKLRAARELGVSRTTLYRRMQALEIAEDCPVL